jgi:hypothetical protein
MLNSIFQCSHCFITLNKFQEFFYLLSLLLEFTGYFQRAASLPDKKMASLPARPGETPQKQNFFVALYIGGGRRGG